MNQSQLKELFEKYSEGLYNYLFRLSRSKEKAQDLLQETFIRIFRKVELAKIKTSEKSYIYKIAYNLFLDFAKQDKSKITQSLDEMQLQQTGPSFADDVHWKMLRESIILKLREADEKFSMAFSLRVDYNMSLTEIAQVMDIPFGTIRTYFEKIQNIIILNFKDELKLNI